MEIASFWPGRFEVIDRQSQRIVAAVATPSTLHAPLKYMRECLRKSLWMSYDWLLAPAPRIAGLAAYTRLQKYVRGCDRTSCEWLFPPVARVRQPIPLADRQALWKTRCFMSQVIRTLP